MSGDATTLRTDRSRLEKDWVEKPKAGTLLASQGLGSDPEVRAQLGADPYTLALSHSERRGAISSPRVVISDPWPRTEGHQSLVELRKESLKQQD